MLQPKKWEILNKKAIDKQKAEDIINIILENRGIETKEDIDNFLNPKLESVTPKNVKINPENLKKAVNRINKAIEDKEQIVVFGDYDVDGITGTAILWETLYKYTSLAIPYIPHRVDEGYGLSIQGIENVKVKVSDIKLIITVDNGIVANEAVKFANEQGIDVIVTDHHVPGKELPNAYSIVHTTKLCGAGVAFLLSQEIENQISKIKNDRVILSDSEGSRHNIINQTQGSSPTVQNDKLELVCLGTIADLVPLTGANRTLVSFGLEALRKTKRPGLQALFMEAGIIPEKIGVYEIGHIIAPRLNAMGRLESAMDSLRLLCTKDKLRAQVLADKLGLTNRERQLMTIRMTEHATERIKEQESKIKNILIIADPIYEQGIIGLIAGRLVEKFYRPAIVLSVGEKVSKASARSVSGFNIIEFIRSYSSLLLEHGGHPMAAGFSIETEKISAFREALENEADELLTNDLLTRNLRIDCELPADLISQSLYKNIQKLSPFGMGNPEPVFLSKNLVVIDLKAIGVGGKHLKLNIIDESSKVKYEAIGFGLGEYVKDFTNGDIVDVVYTLDENTWNGNTKLQLKVKDIRKN